MTAPSDHTKVEYNVAHFNAYKNKQSLIKNMTAVLLSVMPPDRRWEGTSHKV